MSKFERLLADTFQSAKRERTHITVKDKEIFGDEEVVMISALGM
ncbi:hypothetical protein [Bacillus mycoides]|nr:hypothetical protein [Bacillus mycoides]MCQ6530426.1 hypothetical protein [Bacillus mycoides]